MLHKLRSIGIGEQFLSTQCRSGKISASVNEVSGVHQDSVLGHMLSQYTSKLFHILGNYTIGYEDDTTIYAVLLSRFRVLRYLNR